MNFLARAVGSSGRPTMAGRIGLATIWLAATPLALVAQEHSEEASGGIFSLNLGLVVWTWILFLATLGVLVWKVFPAISGGLEERHQKIQGAIDEAHKAREDAEALRAEREAALAAARRDAQEVVEKARAAAEGLRKEILAEAKAQQVALLEDARREIGRERDQLREDIRKEAVDIALAASERLMRTRLDAEENRRLVTQFVSDL